MGKQKLSPLAAKRKAVRDKAYAMSTDRKKKKGINLKGKDYDHTRGKFVSVKVNRGNGGRGTKKA